MMASKVSTLSFTPGLSLPKQPVHEQSDHNKSVPFSLFPPDDVENNSNTENSVLDNITNAQGKTPPQKDGRKNKFSSSSIVWKYFEIPGPEEEHAEKAFCKICKKYFSYYMHTTTNLLKHIHRIHDNESSTPLAMQVDHIDSDEPNTDSGSETLQSSDSKTAKQTSNALSKEAQTKYSKEAESLCWKYFYKTDKNKTLECRVCQKKYTETRYGSFAKLLKHIRIAHSEELSDDSGDLNKRDPNKPKRKYEKKMRSEDDVTLEPHQYRVNKFDADKSIVWKHFMKAADDSYVECLTCNKKLTYGPQYNTSNMLKHLKIQHPEKISTKKALSKSSNEGSDSDYVPEGTQLSDDSCDPNKAKLKYAKKRSDVWNHFKKSEDECFVVCQICKKELKWASCTSNMRAHLRSMHPNITVNSDGSVMVGVKEFNDRVWEYFEKSAMGDRVTCSLCDNYIKQTINTSNMRSHIRCHHPDIDLSSIYAGGSDGLVTPKKKQGRSEVWEYFDKSLDKTTVTCRVCGKSIKRSTNTTNMRSHLLSHHPELGLSGPSTSSSKKMSDKRPKRKRSMNKKYSEFSCEDTELGFLNDVSDDDNEIGNGSLELDSVTESTIPSDKTQISNTGKEIFEKSTVSHHFTLEDGNDFCTCKICGSEISFSNSCSDPLKLHLKTMHQKEYYKSEKGRPNQAKKRFLNNTSYISKKTKSKLDHLLLKMLTTSLQSLSHVNFKSFQDFLTIMNPNYTIPSSSELSYCLFNIYHKIQSEVKCSLMSASKIAVCVDCWKTVNSKDYVTLTAHFLTSSWEKKSFVLSTFPISERFGSVDVSTDLDKILNDWGIRHKISEVVINTNSDSLLMAIVADALESLSLSYIPCLVYALDKDVKSSLISSNEVLSTLNKIRDIKAYFRHLGADFEKEKKTYNIVTPLKDILELDEEDKWMTTLLMLNNYLEDHDKISAILNRNGKYTLCLSTVDVAIVKKTVAVLEPFKLAAVELSGKKIFTLSTVLPMLKQLTDVLSDLEFNDFPLCSKLTSRLQHISSLWINNEAMCISTFLDPRFKTLHIWDTDKAKDIEKQIASMISNNAGSNLNIDTANQDVKMEVEVDSVEERISFWNRFDKQTEQTETVSLTLSVKSDEDSELTKYIDLIPTNRPEIELFEWWAAREAQFPNLCKLANQFLAIPASSVSGEFVFSKSIETFVSKRSSSCVDDSDMDKMIFMNHNSMIDGECCFTNDKYFL